MFYYFADHLGSSRVMTSSTGAVCYDADFYPYGGERAVTTTCPQNYKFTGKERDTETQNDYFGARFHESNLGRFLTPDPLMASGRASNPQTWNRYAYTLNNPLRFIDPYGLEEQPCATTDQECGKKRQASKGIGRLVVTAGIVYLVPVTSDNQQAQTGVAATQTYKTRDEAATAAEKAALAATDSTGRRYEYGGWILKNAEGRYTYTIAVTFKDSEHFYVDKVTIPKGFTAVADYHTHPHNYSAEGEGLSAWDEQHAYDTQRTVYEADTYSRNMYRFTPGVSKYVPNEWCCGDMGDFVAHIPQ